MSAGLPGLGLGGLFFILSALLGPVFELVRAARGQSSPERRRETARQFVLAVLMIVAVELTLRGVYLAISLLAAGESTAGVGATVLPLAPIAITAAVLALVMIAAKGLELVVRARSSPALNVLPGGLARWLLAGVALAAGSWFALFAFGASRQEAFSRDEGGPQIAEENSGEADPTIVAANPRAPAEPAPSADEALAESRTAASATAGSAGRRGGQSGASGDSGSATPPSPPAGTSGGPSGASGGGGSPPGPVTQPPGSGSPPGGGPPAGSGPPPGAGPPAEPGPPPTAGPPPHANAPEGAGPPEHARPGRGDSK